MHSSENGWWDKAEKAFEFGKDFIDWQTPNPNMQSTTYLHSAARYARSSLIDAICKQNPDQLFTRDKHTGEIPLHVAARYNDNKNDVAVLHQRAVEARNNGSNAGRAYTIDALTNDNMTALCLAARDGKPEACEKLLELGADVNHMGGPSQDTTPISFVDKQLERLEHQTDSQNQDLIERLKKVKTVLNSHTKENISE